ncbi:hypothetical protein U9M48_026410 [Paspalum notatum var. saurae]|uniref:KIB1-4 beta-propeller domain-containing protein n=1 Tax=Paspalum notatum var. saurae TaxID=547442 RepID=A0AAQ3TSN5_PASNO
MASPPALWSETPSDILGAIFGCLRSYADHAHASAVCREWYATAVANRRPTPMLRQAAASAFVALTQYSKVSSVCWLWHPDASQKPPALPAQMPWSTSSQPLRIPAASISPPPPALPSPIPASTASPPSPMPPPSTVSLAFLRPFGQGVHYIEGFQEDARRDRFCGSFPGGWLALAFDRWRGHCLFNVNTGDRVDLPDLIRSPAPEVDCVVAIKCLVLSAAPTPDGAYMVAAMASGVSNVAFWHPGTDRWWPPIQANDAGFGNWRRMLPRDPVVDLIYCRGRLHHGFYVLNRQEQLVAYVEDDKGASDEEADAQNGMSKPLTMKIIRYIFGSKTEGDPERAVLARYLVESDGELVMVRHLGSPEEFELFILEEEPALEEDVVLARWRRCPVLGGRALFLGRGCSRSVETGMPLCHVIHCSQLSEDSDWFYP